LLEISLDLPTVVSINTYAFVGIFLLLQILIEFYLHEAGGVNARLVYDLPSNLNGNL